MADKELNEVDLTFDNGEHVPTFADTASTKTFAVTTIFTILSVLLLFFFSVPVHDTTVTNTYLITNQTTHDISFSATFDDITGGHITLSLSFKRSNPEIPDREFTVKVTEASTKLDDFEAPIEFLWLGNDDVSESLSILSKTVTENPYKTNLLIYGNFSGISSVDLLAQIPDRRVAKYALASRVFTAVLSFYVLTLILISSSRKCETSTDKTIITLSIFGMLSCNPIAFFDSSIVLIDHLFDLIFHSAFMYLVLGTLLMLSQHKNELSSQHMSILIAGSILLALVAIIGEMTTAILDTIPNITYTIGFVLLVWITMKKKTDFIGIFRAVVIAGGTDALFMIASTVLRFSESETTRMNILANCEVSLMANYLIFMLRQSEGQTYYVVDQNSEEEGNFELDKA